jgi:eukaryotic-like serine/threonine-protein kinase
MKFRLKLLFLLIAFAVSASACTGGSGGLATSWPGLTTDGETVYLSFASHVYALNSSNGSEIWRFPQEPDNKISFYAAPVLGGDGQLIVGAYNNVLYSLNAETGQPDNWTFTGARNRYIGSPLTTDELILAPSADSYLYAVDFNGNLVWKFLTGEAGWAQPASDGNTVYFSSLDHKLYAIDLTNGHEIWRVDMGGAVVGQPVVGEGVVYVGSFAKTMIAFDASNGDELWSFPTNGWVWAGPSLVDGMLYFGDIEGTFYVVDAKTGEEKWNYTADGGIFSTPLVQDEKIYFTTEAGTLYAFALDNKEPLLSQKIGGKIYTSPVVVQNLILVALLENEKVIIALDENGIERWYYPPITEN